MSMAQRQFILLLEEVNKAFEGFKAISNLTFYLYEGELRTVIGPNGAGKSTFFDLITGRAKPDKVEVPKDRQFVGLNAYKDLMQTNCDMVILSTPAQPMLEVLPGTAWRPGDRSAPVAV